MTQENETQQYCIVAESRQFKRREIIRGPVSKAAAEEWMLHGQRGYRQTHTYFRMSKYPPRKNKHQAA